MLKVTKKRLVLVLSLLLCGCNESRISHDLGYFKDSRTGLCFAVYGVIGMSTTLLTHVPCTPEVERLIRAAR